MYNVYRLFHPPDGTSASQFFARQLRVVKNALCSNCYILGDFNLDGGNDLRPDYNNKDENRMFIHASLQCLMCL